MNKQERMLEIVRLVNLSGTVMVNDLIEILQVSDMTIRRDLASLEQEVIADCLLMNCLMKRNIIKICRPSA